MPNHDVFVIQLRKLISVALTLAEKPSLISVAHPFQRAWCEADPAPLYILCDHCRSRMNLLAQIDSETEADVMWGDSGCLYLFYCVNHPREIKLNLQCF